MLILQQINRNRKKKKNVTNFIEKHQPHLAYLVGILVYMRVIMKLAVAGGVSSMFLISCVCFGLE